MAAAAPDSGPVAEMESLLTCSICLETLKEPRTLGCFHSFCKCCLQKYVKRQREIEEGKFLETFDCPLCRTEFSLKQGEKVEGMLPNHFIRNMLEVLKIQLRAKELPCFFCGSQRPAVSRCTTCEQYLCNKCLTSHNNWPGFNEHVVLTMDELAKPENQAKARGKPRCPKHEKKTLKFYCETCNELVCTHCIVLQHAKPNHSCLPIDEVAEKRRELLKASSVILDEQHKEGNKVLQKIEANTEALKNNAKKAKDDITQQKKAILKAITQKLEEKAALMINEVDRKYNEVYEPLTRQKTDVKAYVDKVKGSMDVAKNLLEKGSHEEVIYIQKLVGENVAKVKRERPWIMKPIHDGNIQFKAKPIVPAMDDGTILNNLGEVVALSVLKKKHLEVDGYLLKLEAKKPKVTFPTDKKKLYVENLSTKTSEDSLLNYVEVITGLEVADVVFGKNNNATVTLNEEPDMNKTKEKAKKKPLEGAALKITNPPVCNSILVTGISEETTKDSIVFKFENPKYGGGEILDVAYQQDQGKAVISYYDPNVINRMVSTERMLNGSKLTVCRHYPFMEGHDEHVVESKKKVITVKPDVMDHVSNRCHNEFSQSFGFPISQTKYDEDKEELTFIILPTGRPAENQIKEIVNYFNKFVVKEIQVSRSLLTNSKNEIEDLLSKTMESFNNKVHAAIDKEKLCILLTGKEDKLGKVTKALQQELDELHKKKEEAIQNLSIDPEKLMFIWSLGFEEKFESESNIEVKIDPQNGILILKGNKELVHSAKMEALEILSKVKEETIELNGRKIEFLASGGLEKINEGLRKRKMKALVCLDRSKPKRAKVELLNSQKFNEVDQYLTEQLSEKSLTIQKESVSLLKDENWRNFRDDLTEKFGIKVFIVGNVEIEVWLTGENSQVQKAYKELKEFVKSNSRLYRLFGKST